MTDGGYLWQLILVMAIGTFAIRVSFIQMGDYFDDLSESATKGLELIPPAILAALVFPRLLLVDGTLTVSGQNPYLLTGITAAIIAWKTDSLLLTVGIGITLLWALQYVL